MKIKLFTIPNILTCLNLISGCLAIAAAFSEDFLSAFVLIAIAAVFDFVDGFAARLFGAYSEIGKELDSLADVISFGAAPSFILICLLQSNGVSDPLRYLILMIAAFSALRLAKFNIDTRQSTEFIGLPTPANAILISSAAYIASTGQYPLLTSFSGSLWTVVSFAGVMSLLLISEMRMFSFKFKNVSFKGNELKYCFLIYAAVSVLFLKVAAIPLAVVVYIGISVVQKILYLCRSKKHE